jgi:deoxyribonuclease IV
MTTRSTPLLGAHVSAQGGVDLAPARGRRIGATAIQVFTKTPNQWREPVISAEVTARFRKALRDHEIRYVVAHDSYLINLASPDPHLTRRSITAFTAELRRASALGLDGVVSHPGNYIDDRARGLKRNAARYTRCLRTVPGRIRLLIENTAGTGTALGSTLEELRALRDGIGKDVRGRVGYCIDTCHLFAAGYDLAGDYDGVMRALDRTLGLRRVRCFHVNDSKTPLGSHRDRHETLGDGTLGPEPFRRLMRDPRFGGTAKIIETPKGDEGDKADRRMLARLRRWGGEGRGRLGRDGVGRSGTGDTR